MHPTGLGVYIRSISQRVHGTPLQAAAKARRNRVRWVAIAAVWQDSLGHRNFNTKTLPAYARAFASAGIDVYLWGYPRCGREIAFARRMAQASNECGGDVKGWLLDPEAGYKWGVRWGRSQATARRGAAQLVALCRPLCNGPLGVTSYGVPGLHRTFPWQEFANGTDFGSPQTYTATDAQIERGMHEWRAWWPVLLPSTAAYGVNMKRLDDYLDAHGPVPGVCVWSWRQLSDLEWTQYALWAAQFGCH